MQENKRKILHQLGIPIWKLKTPIKKLEGSSACKNETSLGANKNLAAELTQNSVIERTFDPEANRVKALNDNKKDCSLKFEKNNLNDLKNKVAQCQLCNLCQTRTQTVFESGNRDASIMLIGEAPGAQEDLKGEPFVGKAGKLLDNILFATGFYRYEKPNLELSPIGSNWNAIYIANILKCRPPNNRDPLPAEVEQCTPYLREQITAIDPKLIIALGRIASHYLLDTKTSLSQLRKKIYSFTNNENNVPLIVTYHPAYLLRNPKDKAKAFEDWLFIRETMVDLHIV